MMQSKDAILLAGKELINEGGIQTLNMRDVAKRCNLSVGSVYNYFPSKEDLIIAAIEDVWTTILENTKGSFQTDNFSQNVVTLFQYLKDGSHMYPSFFSLHSMSAASIDKAKGREIMHKYLGHINTMLLTSLKNDSRVRPDAFNESFTQKDFVEFVFSHIVSLLMRQDTTYDFLLEIIHRSIY